MKNAPKSVRLHIAVFGRTNVGKSSFLNAVVGQDVSITSASRGTTTDVVEKTMELLPLGPVVFLDTAGLDDASELGEKRLAKTRKVYSRADIICLIIEPGRWGSFEEEVIRKARSEDVPVIGVITKVDLQTPENDFVFKVENKTEGCVLFSSVDRLKREEYISNLKDLFIELCPEDFLTPPPLVGDLLPAGKLCAMVVPIDLQAPKGRLILPQVQTIRDALDNDAISVVVKEREYAHVYRVLKELPFLAICDSQVVMKMVADTPPEVKCTTFSMLFSRQRGDLLEAVRGVLALESLGKGDKVLIAEACSHHAAEDDIGRVKIPRWLRQYTGSDIDWDVYAGKDFPENLSEYSLVIHCGGCMINRRLMLSRLNQARQQHVPMTNYGVYISYVQGVLERVLSPFPAQLDTYLSEKEKIRGRSKNE